MLELDSIGKRYGKAVILSDVDACFGKGATVITGPSGAGKSTLLRLCASIERPTSGTVRWNGNPIGRSAKDLRQVLGYAPQRIDFPEDLSGQEFMLHVAALKHLPLGAAKAQAKALLERVGLGPASDRRIAAYSGGMRRRLGLAQAFLGNPEIVILDEPTAELDSETAGHINGLIFETAQHAVVLMTTHLQASLSDRVYELFEVRPHAEVPVG